jgi:hypothetical protein
MNWSLLGKVLVVVHAAMSLGVLAWAFGVSSHRIHWNDPPAGAAEKEGIYTKQKAKATEYSDAAKRAYTRWSGNLFQVQGLEAERYPRRSYYTTKLAMVKTGIVKDAMGVERKVQDPVRHLVIAPNGYLDIRDPMAGAPIEVRSGVNAKCLDDYDKDVAKVIEDTKASQVTNAQAITDRDKLNREIIGTKDPFVKGLRQLINEQKAIEDQAYNEDVYITDAVTNREAEFGLLKKRRDALVARKGELEKKP